MSKTPGTHADDDTSQQPRQTETPAGSDRSAATKEDRTKARENLSDKIGDQQQQRRG
ncbi:MAG: hypothetical protein JSR78_19590 [Proteobacteria bacterium]|nr:hypothetical protein [Pseudomonadota bacterium]